MISKLSSLYQTIVIERPRTTLVVIGVLLLLLMLGLPRFKLDASSDSLTLEHDHDIDYFREISRRYQSGDFLVITYKPNSDLLSDESIQTLKSLRDELLQVEGVASANTILDVPLLYSPLQSLKQIAAEPRNMLSEGVDSALAKKEFEQSPIYRDMLLGPDGQTTAILLNLAVDDKYIDLVRSRDALRLQRDRHGLTANEAQELQKISEEFLAYRTSKDARDHERVAEVRQIAEKYKDRAQIFLGGVSMITADMISFIKSDLVVFGIGILIFIVATLVIIFRQMRFVVLPLAVCLVSVVMMLGMLSWLDWRLTVISSNFVALLLIVALAITIHLVVRYREFQRENPEWSQAQLVFETATAMALPCLYTALTTMVAFISLVVSDIKPVIDFGWMMTIGLGLALLLSFVLLPAGLMVLKKGESKDRGDQSATLTLRFSNIAEKHGNAVVAVSVLAAVISVYGITRLEVENRFIDYFDKSTEIYQGMQVIDQNLGGTITLDIILDASEATQNTTTVDGEDPFAVEDDPFAEADDPFAEDDDPFAEEDSPFADEGDPFASDDAFADDDGGTEEQSYWFTVAGLQEIEQLHDYLQSLPEIGKVQSLAIAYKVASDINRNRLNDFELAVMKNSLPAGIEDILIRPYLASAENQTRITLRAKETDPNLKRAELIEKIRDYAVNEVGLQEEQVHLTGLLVLYNNMLQSLFKSQIVTLGAVFLGIMLMFLVLFRSFTIAIISIIPNILAAGVVLGSMGLVGIPLDMMTITIAAITVGIGVDHAIHYVFRFKKEFALDGDYVAAMHRSHASIGRAMYYTSITIIVGFSILALSKFKPSIYFGLLTSLAMFAAILGSLTLLPKLILITKPLGKEQAASNS